MANFFKVAIDGPSAVGKTTISEALAAKYNFLYFSTGYVYRAAAYYCLKNSISVEDKNVTFDSVSALLANNGIQISLSLTDPEVHVENELVSVETLHSDDVDKTVAILAANLPLRKKLIDLQRQIIEKSSSCTKGIIIEGRDITTVVAPNSQAKFFITASKEVRAARRQKQFQNNGNVQQVGEEIERRDKRDSQTAKDVGLELPEDVIVIDNSHISLEEVVDEMIKSIDIQIANLE